MCQVNRSKVNCNSLFERRLERRPKVGVRDHLNKDEGEKKLDLVTESI